MGDSGVDGVVLPILKEIGCQLDNWEQISAFKNDDFYHVVVTILRTINPDSKYNARLPPSKAARFRLTSQVSNDVKEMGYTGACGYEALLYPNDKDIRKMLMWSSLVDKLPKTAAAEEGDEVMGADALQARAISTALKTWARRVYDPTDRARIVVSSLKFQTNSLAFPYGPQAGEAARYYSQTIQPPLHRQCPPQRLAPSLFELNANSILEAQLREAFWQNGSEQMSAAQKSAFLNNLISEAFRNTKISAKNDEGGIYARAGGAGGNSNPYDGGNSAFQRRAEFAQQQSESAAQVVTAAGVVETVSQDGAVQNDDTEAKLKEERDAQLATAQEKIRKLEENIKKLDAATESQLSNARQLEGDINSVVEECKKLQEIYLVKKRTLDLLPNAEENYRKLKALVDGSSDRLMGLGSQWEQTRVPLINKYRRRKQLLHERKQEVGLKVEQIKVMREELRRKAQALKEKAKLHEQVTAELAALPKSIPREAYVKRIMDVVRNLVKYREEIDKILTDVRRVQKEINSASQTQQRSFSVADDTVYAAAKREQAANTPLEAQFASSSYRDIVKLRDGFAALIKKVDQTGQAKNEVLTIRTQIDALESKNTAETMKTVEADLAQVKTENANLIEQAKKLKAAARGL